MYTLYIQHCIFRCCIYTYIRKKNKKKTPLLLLLVRKYAVLLIARKVRVNFSGLLCSRIICARHSALWQTDTISTYFLFVIYINSSTKHSCTHDWTIQMMFFACPLITVNCVITFFIPWVFFFVSLFIFQSYARSKHDCLITNQQDDDCLRGRVMKV